MVFSDIDEVNNISKFFKDYNKSFNFIKGKVEDTTQEDNLPQTISLLRLDMIL